MANRLKKENYVTESTKQLELELKAKVQADKEQALAKRLVDKIPQHRKPYVLKILSEELATKN